MYFWLKTFLSILERPAIIFYTSFRYIIIWIFVCSSYWIYFGIIKAIIAPKSFEEVTGIITWILQRNKISFYKSKNDTGIILRFSHWNSTYILIPTKYCELLTRIIQAIILSFTYLYHTLTWMNVRKEIKTVSTVQCTIELTMLMLIWNTICIHTEETAGGNFFHQVFF